MALFGEKYPEIVRVVQMGEFSRELCGGTHLDNVGQVGLFKIVGEESVAAGTRRITAPDRPGRARLRPPGGGGARPRSPPRCRCPPSQVADRVAALLDEIKTLKKQAAQRKAETAPKVSADDLLAAARRRSATSTVVVAALENATPDELRAADRRACAARSATGLAVLLVSAAEGKVHLAAGLTPDLVERGLHAGNWLKEVAPVVGGGGGGRPDLAQAGGKDPTKIPDALERAVEFVRAKLGVERIGHRSPSTSPLPSLEKMMRFDDCHRTIVGYHGTRLSVALDIVNRRRGFN